MPDMHRATHSARSNECIAIFVDHLSPNNLAFASGLALESGITVIIKRGTASSGQPQPPLDTTTGLSSSIPEKTAQSTEVFQQYPIRTPFTQYDASRNHEQGPEATRRHVSDLSTNFTLSAGDSGRAQIPPLECMLTVEVRAWNRSPFVTFR